MKTLLNSLKISAILTVIITLLVCFIYPFVVFAIGEICFSFHSNGSLIKNKNRQIIGALTIGQNFSSDHYFHPRPSDAGERGYDAMHSSGSNLGPTSKKYIEIVKLRAEKYRKLNEIPMDVPIPIDPLTSSGSGLDPDISFQNALLQAYRVSKARSLSINTVIQLIEETTKEPFLGLYGSKRVNVLMLNLKLDKVQNLNK